MCPSGKENAADALSRLPLHDTVPQSNIADAYCYHIIKDITPSTFTTREIEEASAKDVELRALRISVQEGLQFKCEQKYQKVFTELSTIGMIVMRGRRIIMPSCLRKQTLLLAHEGHQGMVRTKQRD